MEITIDDISPQIEYVAVNQQPQGYLGIWNNGLKGKDPTFTRYHKQTFTRTTGEGNTARLTFNASSIQVVGSKWYNHSPYTVKIDDGEEVRMEGFAQDRQYNAEIASAQNLDMGREHTITFTNRPSMNTLRGDHSAEGWFDIDYILLRSPVNGELRTTQYDDTAPVFSYEGNWNTGSIGGFRNGTAHSSTAVGASATLSFTGASVQLFGGLSQSHGQYSILLDGVEESRQFNATMHVDVADVPLYTASGLLDGPHTLQIINAGLSGGDGIISLDYAIVNTTLPVSAGPAPPSSPNPPDSTGAGPSGTLVPPLPSAQASTPARIVTNTLPGPSLAPLSPSHAASGSGSDSGSGSGSGNGDAGFGAGSGGGIRTNTAASLEGENSNTSTPPGVVAGIAVAGAVIVGLLILAVWYLRRKLRAEERSASVWAASTERTAGQSQYYGAAGPGLGPGHAGYGVGGNGSASGTAVGHYVNSRSAPSASSRIQAYSVGERDTYYNNNQHQHHAQPYDPAHTRGPGTLSLSERMSAFSGLSAPLPSFAHLRVPITARSPHDGDHYGHGNAQNGISPHSGLASGARDDERDTTFDPFDDMSEHNGPTAFVQRIHSPSAYARYQDQTQTSRQSQIRLRDREEEEYKYGYGQDDGTGTEIDEKDSISQRGSVNLSQLRYQPQPQRLMEQTRGESVYSGLGYLGEREPKSAGTGRAGSAAGFGSGSEKGSAAGSAGRR